MDCSEIKLIFRSIYSLVKILDDRKVNVTNILQLFSQDVADKRLKLIQRCEILLFEDLECFGKKSREILWRKGYYDVITTGKKLWKTSGDDAIIDDEKICLQNLLIEGINRFKNIILNFEKKFNLDLQLLINFKIIDDVNVALIGRSLCAEDEALLRERNKNLKISAQQKEIYTINEKSYMLSTIHALLISLGDFHRYYIDFGFPVQTGGNECGGDDTFKITKDDAAQFYLEAFKLDPNIGMAHNQLGTLRSGKDYDLDSVYHYLQALVSQIPFELSENNVNKIFHMNAAYLEKESTDNRQVEENAHARNFIARLILVIDVFFFDKDVTDFNGLCQFVLMDFKSLIMSDSEVDRVLFTDDLIYKIVATLFFCLIKLRMQTSKKVHSLNAFLVGVCLTLIDVCLGNLERYIEDRSKEIEKFSKRYNKMFDTFDKGIKDNREKYRSGLLTLKDCEADDDGPTTNGDLNETLKKYFNNNVDAPTKNGDLQNESSPDEKSLSNKENNQIDNKPTTNNGTQNAENENTPKKPELIKVNKKSNLRRRRRRFNDSEYESDDDSEERSNEDDENESDSDSNSSLSCFDSSDSNTEESDNDDDDEDYGKEDKPPEAPSTADSDDIIIEEEKIIYKTKDVNLLSINGLRLSEHDASSPDDFVIEEETIIYPENGVAKTNVPVVVVDNPASIDETSVDANDLKYRKVYEKINPNIIIEFIGQERTMKALKVIFDWLKLTPDILVACYVSNPEFIHKIMKLINFFNIDIFTRKVYFERKMVTVPGLREDLDQLFDIRHTIPTIEDVLLKRMVLFEENQRKLDWEASAQLQVTEQEENLIRMLKFVDFAFHLSKMRKFNYYFCTKTRNFIENARKTNGKRVRRGRGGGRREKNSVERTERNGRQGNTRRRRNNRRRNDTYRRNENENEMPPPATPVQMTIIQQRKGYLKNKNQMNGTATVETSADAKKKLKITSSASSAAGTSTNNSNASSGRESNDEIGNSKFNEQNDKNELMGKLWLRNEVQTLELKMKKPMNVLLTPYIVLDTKSLSEYTSIVKNLVKTKTFVVLIPTAVLSELDELKKTSEGVRNAIKWLECEFKKGNRFLRSQRNNETLPLPLIKIKKKLDRETSSFLQIAQFCNHIVTNYADCDATSTSADIVTLLTGDNLKERKSNNFSYTGLLESIPVKYDQIVSFYANYKKK